MEMLTLLQKVCNHICKNWPVYLLAFAGILAVIATVGNSVQDLELKNSIKDLGSENVKLSKEIEHLNHLNIDLAEKNKTTLNANYLLTQKTEALITEVQLLTTETKSLIIAVNERTAYQAAESLQSGELQFNFDAPQGEVSYEFGGSIVRQDKASIDKGQTITLVGEPIKFTSKNGKILINFNVFDTHGNLVAEIVDNYWRPNKNFTGKMNYDEKGFEVINNQGNVAISVDILPHNEIVFQGIFFNKQQQDLWIIGRTATIQLPSEDSTFGKMFYETRNINQMLDESIKKTSMTHLFEYTGKNWLHKRKSNHS